MTDSKSEGESFDPFQAWREIRDRSMDAWAKAMVEAVKSEDYAKASGVMLDAYLTASIPFREMLEKTMAQTLQQMNMPTRTDFTSLAERLTNVEMRLDDFDAKIDELLRGLARPTPSAAKRTAKRTKAKTK
ncbi:MAG: poly(R)-hydroxyalkanoic acid synthase subunit PhaE [Bryobacteraceae bacterium]